MRAVFTLFVLLTLVGVPLAQSAPVEPIDTRYYGVATQGSEDTPEEWGTRWLFLCWDAVTWHTVTLEVLSGVDGDELVLSGYGAGGPVSAVARLGAPATLELASGDTCSNWVVTGENVQAVASYRVLTPGGI